MLSIPAIAAYARRRLPAMPASRRGGRVSQVRCSDWLGFSSERFNVPIYLRFKRNTLLRPSSRTSISPSNSTKLNDLRARRSITCLIIRGYRLKSSLSPLLFPTGVYLSLLGSFLRFNSKKRSPDFKIHKTAGCLCPFDTYIFQTIFSRT